MNESINHISHCFCPWEKHTAFQVIISELAKHKEAQAHNSYMHSRLGDSLLAIYSDASSTKEGTGIGVGLAAFDYSQQGREVYSHFSIIGEGQIVYNGKLEGIAKGFEYAATVATPGQEIRVHADNQAAIHRLKTPSDNSGQA